MSIPRAVFARRETADDGRETYRRPKARGPRRCSPVFRRQWDSEPAVRQRMQVPEAFRQIVERHDIFKAKRRKRALDRHIGRGDDADGKAEPAFSRHLVGLQQPHAGPARVIRDPSCVAIDDQVEIASHDFKEIARQTAQASRPIERERHVRRGRRKRAWSGGQVRHQRRRLIGAWRSREVSGLVRQRRLAAGANQLAPFLPLPAPIAQGRRFLVVTMAL